jgi:hypothetical protein
VLGGPIGVYDQQAFPFLAREISLLEHRLANDRPTRGICLGSQLIVRALGRAYSRGRSRKSDGDGLRSRARAGPHAWRLSPMTVRQCFVGMAIRSIFDRASRCSPPARAMTTKHFPTAAAPWRSRSTWRTMRARSSSGMSATPWSLPRPACQSPTSGRQRQPSHLGCVTSPDQSSPHGSDRSFDATRPPVLGRAAIGLTQAHVSENLRQQDFRPRKTSWCCGLRFSWPPRSSCRRWCCVPRARCRNPPPVEYKRHARFWRGLN